MAGEVIIFIGFWMGVVGKVLVAYMAIRVHHRVRMEHKVDRHVFRTMRREHVLGVFGIAFIIIGGILEAQRFF